MESNISEQLNPCSIWLALNEDCHVNTIFKGTHGLIKATDLSEENKRLLECENIKGIKFFNPYKPTGTLCFIHINV